MSNTLVQMLKTRNVGTLDRVIRALPALVVAVLVARGTLGGAAAWILGALSGMLLLTSILGACSVYYVLGYSTCPISGQRLR